MTRSAGLILIAGVTIIAGFVWYFYDSSHRHDWKRCPFLDGAGMHAWCNARTGSVVLPPAGGQMQVDGQVLK